ncbi:MAG: alpha/beta hydrolase [Clostridia bacterium]|nr:alpha/beta hydrolase [Clostridia bacterium]
MEKYYTVNSDGCSIRSKLYYNDLSDIRKVVLCGHGFSGHKDNKAAEKFAKHVLSKNKGCGVITFDLPCHGEDVRKALRLEDCSKYFSVMTEYIRSAFSSPELFAYMTSFSGYLILRYILEAGERFSKIALRCPAVDMYGVMQRTVISDDDRKLLSKNKPVLAGFDRKVRIDKVFLDSLREESIAERDFSAFASDIFILHGTKDEVVPIDSVKAFADKNGIDFEAVEDADHRFSKPDKMDYAVELITALFDLK